MSFTESLYFYINISENLRKNLETYLKFSELNLFPFPDGEYFAQPKVSVRGKKVFLFHSLSHPVNDNLMKLLITIDAVKRAAAKEINLIITYLAYSRQDRKTAERAPITSKLISNLISVSGANKITTLDLHCDQIEGFFDITIDHLYAVPLFAEYLIKRYGTELQEFVIVSPDFGATKRARMLSNLLSIPIVIMEKIRSKTGEINEHTVYGDVGHKNCLIFDDIIGTGGTVILATRTLKKLGAESITICATHGLFSGEAWKLFDSAYQEGLFSEILVSDSVPLQENKEYVKVISIAKLLSQVTEVYSKGMGSLSKIYESLRGEVLQLSTKS
ncbi:ribose-phosphate pyrophosphokinase [Mycoplasma wenyonii str. Massachusetts]|uniref:ribose-phosphate diphosphokinase n=1 Tax=Mycoplasma wenyonii (strain Massachusetts) TaxID=1197325 RepID=I6YKT9_MYCWM|nr:ribose-phosphate pyrophosphokinase [Mycoplasma wenyonii]AFN64824.1 ribose-phosphate pyrophosphokinase [Mycoplasma wenyonii str. Massachusetts]